MPGYKIMIVEDEEIVVADIQTSVEKMGYYVCATASSGQEAIRKADLTRPNLVLMDIMLKGSMDGIETAAQIKELYKIPVVYLTAFGDDDLIQRAKISEPYGYIMKPYKDRELQIAIEISIYKKKAEDRIEKIEHWLATVLKSIGDAVIASDKERRITFMNAVAEKLTGWKQKDALGKKLTEVLNIKDQDLSDLEKHLVEKVITEGLIINLIEDYLLIAKDGTEIPISDSVAPIKGGTGEIPGSVLIFRDITKRKQAEEALINSEAKYRNIFENAMEGIYQSTPEGRFVTVNAAFARMAGYDSQVELMESITDITSQLYVHPEDRNRFHEIMATTGTVRNFEVEFCRKDGSTFWVVINSRAVRDDQGQIRYYEGIAEDITLRKQAEEQLKKSLDSLRKAFSATIQVMVATVETRDPYTAGHQLRSADLARAIATELRLPQERIEGIRMAGAIHDIGKISVPAEILSKPTKLSELEFSLIKEHARRGFEMLKDIESPWPLAEIVYQHHERMDGSGYPRGLKGKEIIMEARILAVADVVEAMASHRPYRPAIGLNAALAEIENNKGTLYDDDAVDACLRLFREKDFQFEGASF